MLAWFMSFFIKEEDGLEYIDSLSDEDIIVHERVYVPCPYCKRSVVVGYKHKH